MSTLYFVDPSLPGSDTGAAVTGSGTFSDPYNKLPLNYGIASGARTYLMKAGTTMVGGRLYNASGSGSEDTNRLIIGAYGEGPKPKWICDNAGDDLFGLATNNKFWTIRDLDLYSEGTNVIATSASTAVDYDVSNYIINCNIAMISGVGAVNRNGLNMYGAGIKILGNTIDGIGNDALWLAGSDVEVAYNIIKNVGKDGRETGDCVQFGGVSNNAYVHHNFLDHQTSEGKHCIVINEGIGVIFEDNICLHKSNPSVDSHAIFSSIAATIRRNYIQGAVDGIWMESTGGTGLIESNIVVNEAGIGIYMPSPQSYTCQNNTVISKLSGGQTGIKYHNAGVATMATIRRNIVQGFGRSIYVNTVDTDRYSCENNLLYGNGFNDEPSTVAIGSNILRLNPRLDANYIPQEMIAIKMGLTGATKDFNNIDFAAAIGAIQPDRSTYYASDLPKYLSINRSRS
jgi:hypothetical protein